MPLHPFSAVRSAFAALFSGLALGCSPSAAQSVPNAPVPTVLPGYFSFPIMPGKQNFIVGNVGELRGNHFHSGLDVRTLQREGLPVYAAAAGYVSRVGVRTGGYGNVVYLTHPNGLVTVYAHLRNFGPALADYVRKQQYVRQTFELDWLVPPLTLPVAAGEVVGDSGNSGGSGGPHLHFEVRDAQENVLNPLRYGFREIVDNVPPQFDAVGLRTLDANARVNGQVGRVAFDVRKVSAGQYVLNEEITASGNLGVEAAVYDQATGLANRNGVTRLTLELEERPIFGWTFDKFSFAQTRHLNVHTDFATGLRFQRCYLADGNALTIYRTNAQRGRFWVTPGRTYRLRLTLTDSYGNASQLAFSVKGAVATTPPPVPREAPPLVRTGRGRRAKMRPGPVPRPTLAYAVDENNLTIEARHPKAGTHQATVYVRNRAVPVPLVSYRARVATFAWDLRRGLPDSVRVGGLAAAFGFRKVIPPNTPATWEGEGTRLEFAANTLFDTLYLQTQRRGDTLTVGEPTIPLLGALTVTLRPRGRWDAARTLAYQDGECLGGTWKNGQLTFQTRTLGTFTLATDLAPPAVRILEQSANEITVRLRDEDSGVEGFRATLNGQWLLMNYDYKTGLLWSDPLDRTTPLKGPFRLEVTDRAGNAQVITADLP